MKFKNIIINKKSRCIHDRRCQSVKLMKESNKRLRQIKPEDLTTNIKFCQHCMKNEDMKKVLRYKYLHNKDKLKNEESLKHQQISHEYKLKRQKLIRSYMKSIEKLTRDNI